jgi:hypothetical protein
MQTLGVPGGSGCKPRRTPGCESRGHQFSGSTDGRARNCVRRDRGLKRGGIGDDVWRSRASR